MINCNIKVAFLPLAMSLICPVAMSATTTELEVLIQEQDKLIKRLERRTRSTRNVVKQNRSRVSDMSKRLKINGFYSSGVSQMSSSDLAFNLFDIDDDYSASSITKLGIQMTFQVSDDISVTGQLVGKGINDYNIEAEWAYLSWDISDDFTARIGRQRTPYYMLSEYLDVGYAYPWTRPPIEMYKLPLNNMDAISFLYNIEFDEIKIGLQAYLGEGFGDVDQLDGSFRIQNNGLALTAESGNWLFFLGYSYSKIEITELKPNGVFDTLEIGINDPLTGLKFQIDNLNENFGTNITPISILPTDEIDSTYLSAAFTYDNGHILVMAEYGNLEVKDFILPTGDGGYLMIGYHFGKWLPHLTYSKFYTDAKNDKQVSEYIEGAKSLAQFSGNATPLALANGLAPLIQQQTGLTLGVSYDLGTRTKLKFDMTRYDKFGTYSNYELNAQGQVANTDFNGYGVFDLADNAKNNPSNIDTKTILYTFSIDSVF